MFDIYSLAKPRVFKTGHEGSGGFTPSEKPAPDSVEWEFSVLNEFTSIVSEEEAEEYNHPESAGRVSVEITKPMLLKTINIINAASDFGGHATQIVNNPFTGLRSDVKRYRTEFRPKQGLHNLDFTTPAETPSDDTPGGDDNTTQPTT